MVREELVGKEGVMSMCNPMVIFVCVFILLFLVTMPIDAATVEISQTSGTARFAFGECGPDCWFGQGQSFFVTEPGQISARCGCILIHRRRKRRGQ